MLAIRSRQPLRGLPILVGRRKEREMRDWLRERAIRWLMSATIYTCILSRWLLATHREAVQGRSARQVERMERAMGLLQAHQTERRSSRG